MESCFPVAKVVSISSDSVDIKDWFVVFGHRAIGKVMSRLECVLSDLLSQSSQMQLFGVVWIKELCSSMNGSKLGLEAGFQTGSDTMLCGEQKRQHVHDENTIYCTRRSPRSSGNVGLHNN